jgi:ubiquinone/menaquinone biosynthesis C-methylase UbiE
VPVLGRAAQLLGRARSALRRSGRAGASDGGATIADAYAYLPSSVKRFPAPAQLAAELERAGLVEIAYVLLAGGIVAIHSGTVGEGGRR